MERPIDHLVLPVTTLTLARSRLTGLGFTVAPDARHPFGTGNCCVFFRNGAYLEPITFLDRNAADEAAAGGLVFIKRLKRFTERQGEGFAMLAVRSLDAEADQRELEQSGVGGGPVFRFSRAATLPDGSEQEIGVALAYAVHASAPDAAFLMCERTNPDGLWNEAFVSHPNGAEGVVAVTAVAEEPAVFRNLLTAATGDPDVHATPAGLESRMDGSAVAIVTPAEFAARYGLEAPDPRRGLLFAGFDVAVADLDRAIGYAGPTARRHEGRIVVPPSPGFGSVLAFRAHANG